MEENKLRYDMTPEEYRAGYCNLVDIKEKNDKEIKDLKEENIRLKSKLKNNNSSFILRFSKTRATLTLTITLALCIRGCRQINFVPF